MFKNKLLFLFVFYLQIIQAQTLQKNNQLFFIGVGETIAYTHVIKNNINDVIKFHITSKETYSVKSTPNIFLKHEKLVTSNIGLGFNMSFKSTDIVQKYDYSVPTNSYYTVNQMYYQKYVTYNEQITYSFQDFSASVRASYHYLDLEKIHPYVAMGLGFRFVEGDYKIKSTNPSTPEYSIIFEKTFPLYVSATLGLSYFVTNKFGFYAEAGFDKWSILQGGFVFKISESEKNKK